MPGGRVYEVRDHGKSFDWATGNPDPAPRTKPIDDSLFVASGSRLRSISVERHMYARTEEVWAAWTDESAWKFAAQ